VGAHRPREQTASHTSTLSKPFLVPTPTYAPRGVSPGARFIYSQLSQFRHSPRALPANPRFAICDLWHEWQGESTEQSQSIISFFFAGPSSRPLCPRKLSPHQSGFLRTLHHPHLASLVQHKAMIRGVPSPSEGNLPIPQDVQRARGQSAPRLHAMDCSSNHRTGRALPHPSFPTLPLACAAPTLGTSPEAGQFAFDVMAGPGPSFSLIISFIKAVIIFIIPHPVSPRSQTPVQLKASAKAKGLWNLFLPPGEHPGVEGLSNAEYAHLAEVMGRCRIASEACNCSAPDTGNMEVILSSKTPAARRCANDVFRLFWRS